MTENQYIFHIMIWSKNKISMWKVVSHLSLKIKGTNLKEKICWDKNKLEKEKKDQKPKTTLINDLYQKVVDEQFQLFEEKYWLIKPYPKYKLQIWALKSA